MSDSRHLATVQKIVNISPIPGGDRIQLTKVLGWQCVTNKKDNFKVGDLVVYFEIDSQLPAKPEFEFLKDVKYRIKTRKFLKTVSMGLIMPLSILKNYGELKYDNDGNIIGIRVE